MLETFEFIESKYGFINGTYYVYYLLQNDDDYHKFNQLIDIFFFAQGSRTEEWHEDQGNAGFATRFNGIEENLSTALTMFRFNAGQTVLLIVELM